MMNRMGNSRKNMTRAMHKWVLAGSLLVSSAWLGAQEPAAAPQQPAPPTPPMPTAPTLKPIEIIDIRRQSPVDFEKEILPIFKASCLACHNKQKADGDLILETPQTIRQPSDSGLPVTPGRADDSLLLKAASHRVKPIMPPLKNKVKAADLTPEQLGLIKRWINEGATGEVLGSSMVEWEPLPPSLNAIYAVAMSDDGRTVACGRANQVFIYDLAGGTQTRLTDPGLLKSKVVAKPGVAHLDMVQSMAMSPDGNMLATGGFREVKLWTKRTGATLAKGELAKDQSITCAAAGADGKLLATGAADGLIHLWQQTDGKPAGQLKGHAGPVRSISISADGSRMISVGEDKSARLWDMNSLKQITQWNAGEGLLASAWIGPDLAAVGGNDKTVQILKVAVVPIEPPAPPPAPPTPPPAPPTPPPAKPATPPAPEVKPATPAAPVPSAPMPPDKPAAPAPAPAPAKPAETPKPAPSPAAGDVKTKIILEPVGQLKGHDKPITWLAAIPIPQPAAGAPAPAAPAAPAPDSIQLASASEDGSVRLWNIAGSRMVRKLDHGAPVTGLAMRADGGAIASAGGPAVKIWNIGDGKPIAEARGDWRAKWNLSRAEQWQAFAAGDVVYRQEQVKANEKSLTDAAAALKKAQEAETASRTASTQKQQAAEAAAAAKAAAEKAAMDVDAANKQAIGSKPTLDRAAELAAAGVAAAQVKVAESKAAAKQAQEAKAAADKAAADEKDAAKKAALEKSAAEADARSAIALATAGAVEKTAADLAAKAEAAKKSAADTAKIIADADKRLKEAQAKIAPAAKAAGDTAAASASAKLAVEAAVAITAKSMADMKGIESSLAAAKALVTQTQQQRDQAQQALDAAKTAAADPILPYVTFIEGGRKIATASPDGRLRLYSAADGKALEILDGPGGPAAGLAATGAGSLLTAAGPRWSLAAPTTEWTLVRTLGTGDEKSIFIDRVAALEFSRDGALLATGGGEPSRAGELMVWDIAAGKPIMNASEAHSDAVLGLAFSHDGRLLASSAADKFVRVFEARTGKHLRSFEGHTHHVLGVSWRRDGRLLASSGADKVVKVWNIDSGAAKTIGGFNKEVSSITFLGAGDNAVTTSGDGQVRLVTGAGAQGKGLSGPSDFVHRASASGDGGLIAAGGQDGTLWVWKADGQAVASFKAPEPGSGSSAEIGSGQGKTAGK